MRWLADQLAWAISALVLLLLAADAFLWQPHPIAMLIGRAVAHPLDPVLVVPALIAGLALGAGWRSVLAALAWSAVLEFLAGRSAGFQPESWLARWVAALALAALAAGLKALLARKRTVPAQTKRRPGA